MSDKDKKWLGYYAVAIVVLAIVFSMLMPGLWFLAWMIALALWLVIFLIYWLGAKGY